MSEAVERLEAVAAELGRAEAEAGRPPGAVRLVAVSKTFGAGEVRPLLEAGHRLFGENRVQEAGAKWPDLRRAFPDLELHLIGPLQSNKARDAVKLFDAIQTVDRDRLAGALADALAKETRAPKLFVQVNTGAEPQKAGVSPRDAAAFVARCRERHGLAVAGLMCIPPADENPGPHFALLEKLGREAEAPELSMGMSGDYALAVRFGATLVRVGSAIFGAR